MLAPLVAASTPIRTRAAGPWRARLDLGYERRGERTVLVRRSHSGPLVVQKSLYPEGDAPCQNIIVHPPGGVAGGDELELRLAVGAGAHAQFTTPGASKWYRSAGPSARQTLTISVESGGLLEWLPQEAVVFDGALAAMHTSVALQPGAAFIGWDTVCLGRTASGERFRRGLLRQAIEVRVHDRLVWTERSVLEGDGRLLHSPVGLMSQPVFGTFIAAGIALDDETLARCRSVGAAGDLAVTRLPQVLVGRYRGASTAAARAAFVGLWRVVRSSAIGREALPPRIWST